jgi:hypothetical protein
VAHASERRSESNASIVGGVDLSQNSARSGGAVALNGASLSVEGEVSFAGNAATGGNGGGGAVSAVSSDLQIDGASFSGNAAKSGTIRIWVCGYMWCVYTWMDMRMCLCCGCCMYVHTCNLLHTHKHINVFKYTRMHTHTHTYNHILSRLPAKCALSQPGFLGPWACCDTHQPGV